MSYKVTALIRSRKVGSPTRKCILLVMSDVANHDGSDVWISTQTMANETEVSQRTIKRQLKDMEAEGILIRRGKKPCMGGHTVNYQINIAAISKLKKSGDILSNPDLEAVTPVQEVVTEGAKKDAPSVTQTVLEQSSLNNTLPLARDVDVFEALWKDISPRLPKSRRVKHSAKLAFVKMAKTESAPGLADGLRRFYSDRQISKQNYEFAPAMHVAIKSRRFEPYLFADSGGEFVDNRREADERREARRAKEAAELERANLAALQKIRDGQELRP